ncbi:calmegin [Leptonychotes weddellii]|uniref:Calmegin n=1 Tax=Leptonychotes weddellii TaxID=9713 RepID=A0A7F8Q5Q7_LEPWE|nr:calmegin [Leptonychotes weddellii]
MRKSCPAGPGDPSTPQPAGGAGASPKGALYGGLRSSGQASPSSAPPRRLSPSVQVRAARASGHRLRPHAHARLAVAAERPPAGLVWGSAGTKWQRLGHLSCHCRKRARRTGRWEIEELKENRVPGDRGLVLKSRAKHHAIAAVLAKPFIFADKPLIVQYEVNFQDGIDCGGAYIKLLADTDGLNLENFYDKTSYTIMFGPDKCGEDYKLHFIFRHKHPKTGVFEEKHAKPPDVDLKKFFTDRKTHLYTLWVLSKAKKDDTDAEISIYDVSCGLSSSSVSLAPAVLCCRISSTGIPPSSCNCGQDPPRQCRTGGEPEEKSEKEIEIIEGQEEGNKSNKSGSEDEMKEADESTGSGDGPVKSVRKRRKGYLELGQTPDDIDIRDESEPAQIEDLSVIKPDGWLDDEPKFIPDPNAEKPDDWNEDMDGEWEAPRISNPACRIGCGEWTPPLIDNPKYKGVWRPPMIDNPNYQGIWSPRKIPNPDYFEDDHPFLLTSFRALGLELWSMTSDIYFDNFIICSEKEIADRWAADGWGVKIMVANANEPGIFKQLVVAAEERPWLWLIYLLTAGLPIALIASFCWPRKFKVELETRIFEGTLLPKKCELGLKTMGTKLMPAISALLFSQLP